MTPVYTVETDEIASIKNRSHKTQGCRKKKRKKSHRIKNNLHRVAHATTHKNSWLTIQHYLYMYVYALHALQIVEKCIDLSSFSISTLKIPPPPLPARLY